MSEKEEIDSESDEESDLESVHHGVPIRSCWYWSERRKRYVHVNFNKKLRVQEQIYLCDQKRYRYSRSSSIDFNDDRASMSSLEPTSEEEAAEEEKKDLDVHRTLWFTKILPELCKKFPEKWLITTFGDNYKEYNERAARIIAHIRKEESEYNLDDDLRDEKIPQSIKEAEIQAVIESVEDAVVLLATNI